MNKLKHLWSNLRATFWFLPSLIVAFSTVLAVGLIEVDSSGGGNAGRSVCDNPSLKTFGMLLAFLMSIDGQFYPRVDSFSRVDEAQIKPRAFAGEVTDP